MSNIQQLINFITERKTYEEVKQRAFKIDKNWRSETWTRGLRDRKGIQAIYKGIPKKSPIIAYEPFKTQEKPSPTSDVDDRLRTILKGIKPSWDNQPKIKELEHALKLGDNYKYQKLLILNKYGY